MFGYRETNCSSGSWMVSVGSMAAMLHVSHLMAVFDGKLTVFDFFFHRDPIQSPTR